MWHISSHHLHVCWNSSYFVFLLVSNVAFQKMKWTDCLDIVMWRTIVNFNVTIWDANLWGEKTCCNFFHRNSPNLTYCLIGAKHSCLKKKKSKHINIKTLYYLYMTQMISIWRKKYWLFNVKTAVVITGTNEQIKVPLKNGF